MPEDERMSRASRMHDGEVVSRVLTTALIVVAVVGIFALAKWAQPMLAESRIEEAQERCQSINDTGEQYEGELAQCMSRLAHLEATHGR